MWRCNVDNGSGVCPGMLTSPNDNAPNKWLLVVHFYAKESGFAIQQIANAIHDRDSTRTCRTRTFKLSMRLSQAKLQISLIWLHEMRASLYDHDKLFLWRLCRLLNDTSIYALDFNYRVFEACILVCLIFIKAVILQSQGCTTVSFQHSMRVLMMCLHRRKKSWLEPKKVPH
jgi:hypothetical protein